MKRSAGLFAEESGTRAGHWHTYESRTAMNVLEVTGGVASTVSVSQETTLEWLNAST